MLVFASLTLENCLMSQLMQRYPLLCWNWRKENAAFKLKMKKRPVWLLLISRKLKLWGSCDHRMCDRVHILHLYQTPLFTTKAGGTGVERGPPPPVDQRSSTGYSTRSTKAPKSTEKLQDISLKLSAVGVQANRRKMVYEGMWGSRPLTDTLT